MTEILTNKMSDQGRINQFRQSFTSKMKALQEKNDNIAANKKNSHYYEMDSSLVGQNIATEQLMSKCDQQIKNYALLDNHLTIKVSNLEKIQDIALEAKKVAARAMNIVGKGGLDISSSVSGLLSALEDALSDSSFGLGLWNGSRATSEDTTLPLTKDIGSQHNSNYYLGDSANHTLFLNGREREYGSNAAEASIATLIEGLKELRDSQVNGVIKKTPDSSISGDYSVNVASQKLDQAMEGLNHYRHKLDTIHSEVIKTKESTENLQAELSTLYNSTLNGINPEDLAQYILELRLEQQQLAYCLPFMKRSMEDFSILKYL